MSERFYLIVTFLVDICPKPMRDMFVRLAKADTGHSYTTLNAYIKYRKRDIYQLKHCRVLKKYQYNLVLNSPDAEAWDITLLTTLLKELFPAQTSIYSSDLDDIRQVRNDIQHLSGTTDVSEDNFSITWSLLEKSTINLADSGNKPVIQKQIDAIKTSYIANIADVLRTWYTDEIIHLRDSIEDLSSQVNAVKEDTSMTMKIINEGTVKRSRSGGGKTQKRFRTVDPLLERMRGTFANTVKQHLSKHFEPPAEISKIRSELKDNHFVIVSGFGNSMYLSAALLAITELNYADQDCAEIKQPSDWRHIDPKEISLVLFLHPFGQNVYESEKAKAMFDILGSIKDSTTADDDSDKIDVVIVTDQGILNQFMQTHYHEILETVVSVYQPTTENTPANIDTGNSGYRDEENDQYCKSISVPSVCYRRENKNKYTGEKYLSVARETFQKKKIIVISGPRECGKTTLALTLLHPYQEGHFAILTDPEGLYHVKYDFTCAILIEDMGGKYFYDERIAQKWLQKLDVVYPLVKQGKLNVIITCGTEILKTIRKELLHSHPMLEHVVTLQKGLVVEVKDEPHASSGCRSSVLERSPGRTRFTGCTTNVVCEDIFHERDNFVFDPPSFCQSKDGFYILWTDLKVGNLYFYLDFYDSNFQLKHTFPSDNDDELDWSCTPQDICSTEDGNLLVLIDKRIEIYTIGETFTLKKSVDLETLCNRIFEDGNIILAISTGGEICQFDTNLKLKKRYKVPHIFRYVDKSLCHPSSFALSVHGGSLMMVGIIEDEIYVVDCHTRQINSRKIDNMEGILSVYSFDEDSFLVLARITTRKKHHPFGTRILQLNFELDILSDVTVDHDMFEFDIFETVYDKTKHRILILYGNYEHCKICEFVLK